MTASEGCGESAGLAPRILLHYPVLNTGGAEKSILRLLRRLVDRGCEVDLVLTSGGGSLEGEIDPRVTVFHLRDRAGFVDTSSIRNVPGVGKLLLQVCIWLGGRLQEVWRRRKFRHRRYDAAIAGLHGLSPAFICDHVLAARRIVMIRNDAADDKRGRLRRNVERYHGRIDAYVCVSKGVLRSLRTLFPILGPKSTCIYNILDARSMEASAEIGGSPFPDDGRVLRVLSICRLDESQKALLRMVDVHRRLLHQGHAHLWYVVGDGPDRPLLERAIASSGVATTFRLLGATSNPFPYYKHADICAVLSRYEGLCGVVNEARILERAVVATRFAGIEEQVENGVSGLIVEQDADDICAGLASLIDDGDFRNHLAAGGFPAELEDDDAKISALLSICGILQCE